MDTGVRNDEFCLKARPAISQEIVKCKQGTLWNLRWFSTPAMYCSEPPNERSELHTNSSGFRGRTQGTLGAPVFKHFKHKVSQFEGASRPVTPGSQRTREILVPEYSLCAARTYVYRV